MATLPLITWMFALTVVGALTWLSIRAFKMNPGWGFSVLLLSPFSATAFGVKYWKEQREPFLLYITTFTATLALCVYLFTASGGLNLLSFSAGIQQEIHAQTRNGNNADGMMHTSYAIETAPGMESLVEQDPALASQSIPEGTSETPDTNAVTDMDTEQTTSAKKEKSVRYRLTYIPIKLSEARNYIGVTAKITRRNVREKEYLITGASHRHIELAQRRKGGQYSFHFKNSDVEKIRVLINEPY